MSPNRPPVLHIAEVPHVYNRYIWCKTVTAVNLSVHCFYSLVGSPQRIPRELDAWTLELPPAPAYYLCGVTQPYVWELNSHLLAVPDPTVGPRSVTTPGLSVTMEGLRVVQITDRCLDTEAYGGAEDYVSCRNLQAAAILAVEYGLDNERDRASDLARKQAARAGLLGR